MSKRSAPVGGFGVMSLFAAFALILGPSSVRGAAQSPNVTQLNLANALRFDVASVRENKAPSGDGPSSNVPLGPGNVYSPVGGLFHARNFTLLSYIAFAYRMSDHQLSSFAAMAPEWVKTKTFNIEARTDNRDVTKNELRSMVLSLLTERFNFSAHCETERVSVYALKRAALKQPAPQLKAHPEGSSCPSTLPVDPDPPPSAALAGTFPATCGGIVLMPASAENRVKIGGRDITLALLANSLTGWGQLENPVIDQTGLTGNFDFALEYVPEIKQNSSTPQASVSLMDVGGPTFREALKQQLGLKLESQRGEVQVIVLDHIDPLIAN